MEEQIPDLQRDYDRAKSPAGTSGGADDEAGQISPSPERDHSYSGTQPLARVETTDDDTVDPDEGVFGELVERDEKKP